MFSVIIPTLNEEKYLGRLLESIKKQHLQPEEVIVADYNSEDKTREVAREHGCKVVMGGTPAEGRNRGAAAASEDILVFLDADTQLQQPDTFNIIIGTFIAKSADVASCYAKHIEEETNLPSHTHLAFNATKRINKITTKYFNNVVGELGFSIIVRRKFFENIGGFNEKNKVWEDSEFFRRSLQNNARYYVIPVHIGVSDRRFSDRDVVSSLKITGMVLAMGAGMFLGWKGWQKYMDSYEKEKGQLGGKVEKKNRS